MTPWEDAAGLAVALGIGLLVGIERERRKGLEPRRGAAGLRTFALAGFSGGLAAAIGPVALAVAGVFVALMTAVGTRSRRGDDAGSTTEFAMLVVFLLGALSMREPALAGAGGVLVALLLAGKSRLHRFVRTALTEQELHDGLQLAAAAAIVLPLLPDRTVDPWDVLNPRKLWLLAVIVMVINAVGHVALRTLGTRAGLLMTGLVGGFASSTATTAALGGVARRDPVLATACASAALLSNVSTVVQLAVVTAAIEMRLLAHIAWPLVTSGAVIAAYSAFAFWRGRHELLPEAAQVSGRAFELRHVLLFVAIVAVVLVASAATHDMLGNAALWATLALSGLADVHAAAASAAQLVSTAQVPLRTAAFGVAMALVTNSTSKLVLAFATGGRHYGMQLLPGLLLMVAGFVAMVVAYA